MRRPAGSCEHTANPRLPKAWSAAIILAVFVLLANIHAFLKMFAAYEALRDAYPYWVAGTLRNSFQILGALACGFLLVRGRTLSALGLKTPRLRDLLVPTLAVVPLYGVFAFTAESADSVLTVETAYLAGISPIAEEVLYRGFAFLLLYRLVGWRFSLAVSVPALVFAAGHLVAGSNFSQTVGVFAITLAGALLFSWLTARLNAQIWSAVVLHVLMNLAWQVFDVGDSAFAGWLPTLMQLTTAVLTVVLVWRSTAKEGGPGRA